jgi:hypothetical protein
LIDTQFGEFMFTSAQEIAAVSEVVAETDQMVVQLSDLELLLVGGGSGGDPAFV